MATIFNTLFGTQRAGLPFPVSGGWPEMDRYRERLNKTALGIKKGLNQRDMAGIWSSQRHLPIAMSTAEKFADKFGASSEWKSDVLNRLRLGAATGDDPRQILSSFMEAGVESGMRPKAEIAGRAPPGGIPPSGSELKSHQPIDKSKWSIPRPSKGQMLRYGGLPLLGAAAGAAYSAATEYDPNAPFYGAMTGAAAGAALAFSPQILRGFGTLTARPSREQWNTQQYFSARNVVLGNKSGPIENPQRMHKGKYMEPNLAKRVRIDRDLALLSTTRPKSVLGKLPLGKMALAGGVMIGAGAIKYGLESIFSTPEPQPLSGGSYDDMGTTGLVQGLHHGRHRGR